MTELRPPRMNRWKTLDKDLRRIAVLERATAAVGRPSVAIGIALAFVALCGLVALSLAGTEPGTGIIVLAATLGAYMALNIGANDVANNMGPAVGAEALTMFGALALAAIFETAGSLIAGSDVVATVASGIIAPSAVASPDIFIRAMLAALIAASLWLNLATWLGAPVSTTHAIIGGVAGAGVAAAGLGAVNWGEITRIAASWIISPLLGGGIAALLLSFITAVLIDAPDKIAAARRWVPALIGLMAGAFVTYLALKGLNALFRLAPGPAALLGLAAGLGAWAVARPVVRRRSEGMENRKRSLKALFSLPLIAAAALLSFAHGANDVANAVGPLAAIVHAVREGGASGGSVTIPLWVMLIGAFGISFGLVLFGPRLIRMVGQEITRLNALRAWCVALAAAVTVILASALGLPVSSTHIAVGGIFGVGFYREWDAERRARRLNLQKGKPLTSEERRRRKLVRRAHVLGIGAAWVVTVPLTAFLSAGLYLVIAALG